MAESRLEKPVRASFLTTLNRRLAKKAVVIADGLNYIKGYRYQMNCAAKEAGVRYCTVRVFKLDSRRVRAGAGAHAACGVQRSERLLALLDVPSLVTVRVFTSSRLAC